MFLDYDGTLSPIVEDPDSAVMTDEVKEFEKQSKLCSYRLFLCNPCLINLLTHPSLPVHTDEGGGAQRGGALPDGDRERSGQRQGTTFVACVVRSRAPHSLINRERKKSSSLELD
jgi:hypothetical protein